MNSCLLVSCVIYFIYYAKYRKRFSTSSCHQVPSKCNKEKLKSQFLTTTEKTK